GRLGLHLDDGWRELREDVEGRLPRGPEADADERRRDHEDDGAVHERRTDDPRDHRRYSSPAGGRAAGRRRGGPGAATRAPAGRPSAISVRPSRVTPRRTGRET